MRTNISRHTCMYSDVAWPVEGAGPHDHRMDVFAHSGELGNYLRVYAKRYVHDEDVRTCTRVTRVDFHDNKWRVQSCSVRGHEQEEDFEYLIVATGFFSTPYTPPLPGLTDTCIPTLHAANFKDPGVYKGKTVAVVGASLSAIEIAGALAPFASIVHHIATKPYYSLPPYLPVSSSDVGRPQFLPMDLTFYRRSTRSDMDEQIGSTSETNRKKHEYFSSILSDPPFPPNVDDPPQIGISDLYSVGIRVGVIKPHLARLASIDPEASILNLSSGEHINSPDFVIFCTGYTTSLPFFSSNVQHTLSYDPKDRMVPLLTHRLTLHPDLPNAGFVGFYRGSYYGVVELQARYLASLFAGEVQWPSDEAMQKGVDAEKDRRIACAKDGSQFPHGDYGGLFESYARSLGVAHCEEDAILAVNYPVRRNEDVDRIEEDLAKTFTESARGAWVMGAVFRSWAGRWHVRHTICLRDSDLNDAAANQKYDSIATFHVRAPSGQETEKGMLEYVYYEDGAFADQTQCAYRYHVSSDTVSIWRIEGGGSAMHEAKVRDREYDLALGAVADQSSSDYFVEHRDTQGWDATGNEYVHGENVRRLVRYKFCFRGAEVIEFGVAYAMRRAGTEYEFEAWYRREREVKEAWLACNWRAK